MQEKEEEKLTRAERRRQEREQPDAKNLDATQRAFGVFLVALEKSLKNLGYTKAKMDSIMHEMNYAMSEIDGKPVPKVDPLLISEYETKLKLNFSNMERQEYIQLYLTRSTLISMVEELSKRGNLSKNEVTWFKQAYAWLNKGLLSIQMRLSDEERRKVNQYIEGREFLMLNKKLDKEQIEKAQEDEAETKLTRRQFEVIAEWAIEARCRGCNRCDYTHCELFQAQWQNNVEPQNYYENGCPYKLEVQDGKITARRISEAS